MNRIFLASACALLLAGCGSTGSTIGNLVAFNAPAAPTPIEMMQAPADKVDCPIIDVAEGGAAYQIGSGAGLRHQFALGELSRECSVVNKQIVIRVGVSGRVLAGPAGGPGTFTVPVRVGVRRDADQKMLVSKVYPVKATIPAGQVNAVFTFVADPMTVPFMREEANNDYTIVVGLARQ
jgi:hypothetical protein